MGEKKKEKRNAAVCLPHKHREINHGCNVELLHGALFAGRRLHVDAPTESRWRSAAENTHKSIWCRTPINPHHPPSPSPTPTVPSRFPFTSVAICLDTEVRSYTARYPRFTIKQCQDLDWISWCRWPSAGSPGCVSAALPGELTAHLVIHSRRAVTPQGESRPHSSALMNAHEAGMWRLCLRNTAYIH